MIQTIKKGLFLTLLLSSFSIQAQVKKGLKFVEKKQYDKAILAFEKDLSNPKEQAAAEFSLAQIYGNPKIEQADLEKGYNFANQALATAAKVDEATKKKLNERKMGLMSMRSLRDKIVVAALDKATKENTSSAYNDFLRIYKELSKPQLQKAHNNRNQAAFNEAKAAKTGTAMEDFWRLYAESCLTYSPELYKIAEKELLEAYIRQNSWSSFTDFASRYPENVYVKDKDAAVKMQLSADKNTITSYRSFLEAYPTSPFAKIATDSIHSHTLQSANLENFDYFVRTFPNYPNNSDIWNGLYKLFCQTSTCPADFYKSYPNAPKNLK